jgi:hypothetical protein
MITAAMLAYYALAFALIYGVAYFTYQQNMRRSQALVDRLIAELQAEFGNTPPLEPYVREPLPELPEPELRITITRHPESDGDRLPKMAAEMIRAVSRLEKDYGGDGLEYDPVGSVEEPGRLVLRLVPRSADWEAADRLVAVANHFMRHAKDDAIKNEDADIRAQIERELQPHLPPAIIENVRVTTDPHSG